MFVPNKFYSLLLWADKEDPSGTDERSRQIIQTVTNKYGDIQLPPTPTKATERAPAVNGVQTAWAVFTGPSIVFGGITARYRIDKMLAKAFGDMDSDAIMSLAWFLASEGDALTNSDVWLDHYETPAGRAISSQEVTRLLDRMTHDGIMTFYKEWLAAFERTGEKVLYDLTSISWYGQGINMAGWGHNRDNDSLPQVNYALMCARKTGMPLFAWPLDGSVTDVRTLRNTMQFLRKLDYKPDCLMMDRAFGSIENISAMFKEGYTFLQALRLNADWIRNIVDLSKEARLRPDSMLKEGDKVYYASTTACRWVLISRTSKKGDAVYDAVVQPHINGRIGKYEPQSGEAVLGQYRCTVHVLYCQDLVGGQWNKFMERLNSEYSRLMDDANAQPSNELKRYFIITKEKWARKRSVGFNMPNIEKHRNNYAGYTCFITNDKTITVAKDALSEYSTRDYIEKDFDEMKNELDMRRIRVHSDNRMKARLLIQFIAEIYLREIRTRLKESDECKKMTRKQISSHIKGIYKIKFKNKYKDVRPELSKSQRSILDALGFKDLR